MLLTDNYKQIKASIPADKVTLVVVSKTHPVEKIMELYQAGVRDFGENKVQEMIVKAEMMPNDIRWHLIGHLQSNKVKFIADFVHLIQSVDSLSLLEEINKAAKKANRVVDCLLQIYIAAEETKFGLSQEEALEILNPEVLQKLTHIRITGLMGMATNTENMDQVKKEFQSLKVFFDEVKEAYFNNKESFKVLSMGMSGDYELAIGEGSTLVRVGSAIFGAREYPTH